MRQEQIPQLNFSASADTLKPLIRHVVAEALAQYEGAWPSFDRIAYSESEAAKLIGLEPHQLRDERYRGRIQSHRVVGGRIRYLPEDLRAYVVSHPMNRTDKAKKAN